MRLALLGDRRKGVGRRADGLPDIDWRRIDGGEVTIEIRSSDDANSEVINRLTRTIERFWMARYPVTIDHFRAFLGECYRDGTWQLPAGFAVNLPADYPPPKHRARHGNHPADSVNWYDAAAFCHWLSARLDFEVRLPTEGEWQLAATGGDLTRTYPWGPGWDPKQEPWRANTSESGLERCTAVGMYPAGASAAGIEDMAGTVWEWCQNAYDGSDNTGFPQSSEVRRVLRGGSWSFNRVAARSAYRLGSKLRGRDSYIGFRVVCSSPSSGTDH